MSGSTDRSPRHTEKILDLMSLIAQEDWFLPREICSATARKIHLLGGIAGQSKRLGALRVATGVSGGYWAG